MRILSLLILLWFYSRKCLCLPYITRIVGIFDKNDYLLELAFKSAVQSINMDSRRLQSTRLEARTELLSADDSFHTSKIVCTYLKNGVAGIFGPSLENTANHVQSICEAMKIPHIETRWDFKRTRNNPYSINLHPHPKTLSQAYFDVIKALDWKKFVILYEENYGLMKLQTLLKNKDWQITIRQLKEDEDWRPVLKEIMKARGNKFVVDVSSKNVFSVLSQAKEIGLINDYSSFFFTSLDMDIVNLENFSYSGTNITALRLFDPNNENNKKLAQSLLIYGRKNFDEDMAPKNIRLTTEAALMLDAVSLFGYALDNLHKSKVVEISPLHCEGDRTWKHGRALIDRMKWFFGKPGSFRPYTGGLTTRKSSMYPADGMYPFAQNKNNYYSNGMPDQIKLSSNLYETTSGLNLKSEQSTVTGLTGIVRFDEDGYRTDVDLQIAEFNQRDAMKQIGTWTKAGGVNFTRTSSDVSESLNMTRANKTFIVITADAKPYTIFNNSSERLEGNDRFEGFCVDLIEKIAEEAHFSYKFELEPKNAYGSYNEKTKEWDGMIRALLNHKADLAIVDFTITHERQKAVDFSMPFMNLGIGIIYKKPTEKERNLFSFMLPFSIDVWIYMATAYLGVSVLLFILARITPNEWDNPHPCTQDPDELENSISLSNAFWFTIGSLMQQGSDIAPKAMSTRIVAGIWWFFTLIMISSYTANLAAFLTAERMKSPIEGAEDLVKQTKIKYGCKHGGSTMSFFEQSNIPTYQRMWSAMSSARPSVFTTTNELGVQKVSTSDHMYAFLMESVSIEYEVERQCDLMMVGGLLDSKSYGIGLPPGSPYTGMISSAILKLKEAGVIENLKTKWWKDKGGRLCKDDEAKGATVKAAELGLPNVGGVFVVLIGGMGTSAIIAICEFLWNARELATDENASFCEELNNEVKFILKCSGNTKPVRRTQSSSPEEPLFTYGSNNYDPNYAYGRAKK